MVDSPRAGRGPDPWPGRVPVLTDGTVTLRAHAPSDASAIVEQCTDPATVRFTTVPRPYTTAHAREFLTLVREAWEDPAGDGARYWAVEAAGDDGTPRFAGSIDYRPDGPGVAELGFGLHPWARGRGVMARAVHLAADHAFTRDGVRTLRWHAVVGNWASRRVAWRCGFRLEGTVRDLLDQPDGRYDGWVASLGHADPRSPAHPWLEPVPLEGARIRLRPWRDSDLPVTGLDATARRFMGPALPPAGTDEFAAWLLRRRELMASGAGVAWCVADAVSDEVLGHLECFGLDDPFSVGSAHLGYWLLQQARGHGVLQEALGLFLDHAFTSRGDGGLGAPGGGPAPTSATAPPRTCSAAPGSGSSAWSARGWRTGRVMGPTRRTGRCSS